jgi:hypothetical protein
MDKEEVKKFLESTSEGKSLLASLVEDHPSIIGLKEKNQELVTLNKTFKRNKEDAEKALSEVTEEYESFKKEGSKVDIEKEVAKAVAKVTKELETERQEKSNLSERMQKLIVDNSLNDALNKANIAKSHVAAVRALLKSENKITIDDTENVAKIGDKDLSTFVQEWAQGEGGKIYVAAPLNTGGGATGSKTGVGTSKEGDISAKDKIAQGYGIKK